ncbi:MAG: N-acetylmuramoyl-L-alanine amidase [Oscillospiraceae bacterium]|nr:N-acetylmuramoyl-L-alanine amidase [Oscillospiraceae bacterium]
MEIIEKLCPESEYSLKCPYAMNPVGVCIHNTANDASAANEVSFMLGNDSTTGFHFAVDDKEVIQAIPTDRNAWHAGDGNGDGNRKYISIEICYSKSGGPRFEAAMKNAAELTAWLLTEHGWDLSHVKKHQDFSGKNCPQRILESYGWNYYLDLVNTALGEVEGTMANFSDTAGHWAENLIEELADMGIVQGDENGNFRPDDPATRAEAAEMIRNTIKYITGK